MKKSAKIIFSLVFFILSLTSYHSGCKKNADVKGPITIGSKEFTEQLLLGKITIIALRDAGFEVVDKTGLGGTSICREALINGEIDMYWEYTGTALMAALGHEKPITNAEQCYEVVKKEDLKNGIVWLNMAPLNNTYTLMMTLDDGASKGIDSLSDLSKYIKSNPNMSLGTDHEFYIRPDGIKGVEKLYGFKFAPDKVVTLDWGLVYKALKEGQVNVAMGFATDGRISAYNLFNLKDDKKFFPVYNPAPNVRMLIFEKYPDLKVILSKIASKLDTKTITELNKMVDVDEIAVEKVALNWLQKNSLMK